MSLSLSNHAVHQTIAASVFALSLDDWAYSLPPSHKTPDADLAAHLHNIRSGHGTRPGHNRWYDKPFTLIVESNTRAGVLGEHSPVDALVPSVIADYAIVQGVDEDVFSHRLKDDASELSGTGTAPVEGWARLDWVVDDVITKECEDAAARAKVIVDDSDADELVFDGYGVDWIKNQGTTPGVCPPTSLCSLHHAHGNRSATLAGRVHPNGAAACVVPHTRRVHRDVRDRAHAPLQAWPHRDDPHALHRQPRLGPFNGGPALSCMFSYAFPTCSRWVLIA